MPKKHRNLEHQLGKSANSYMKAYPKDENHQSLEDFIGNAHTY